MGDPRSVAWRQSSRPRDHDHSHRRCVPLEEMHRKDPRPLPIAINGASGPSTDTEAQRGEGSRDDAEELDRLYRPARFEALRRLMPPRSGQVTNSQSDEQTRSRSAMAAATSSGSPWNPALVGRATKYSCWSFATASRKSTHPLPRDTDDRSDEEQHDVAPRPDDRRRVRRAAAVGSAARLGRGRRVGHCTLLRRIIGPQPCSLAAHGRRAMAQTLLSTVRPWRMPREHG